MGLSDLENHTHFKYIQTRLVRNPSTAEEAAVLTPTRRRRRRRPPTRVWAPFPRPPARRSRQLDELHPSRACLLKDRVRRRAVAAAWAGDWWS